MKLGIIGAGSIGSTVAAVAIKHGHTVVIANSRGPQTLGDLVAQLGPAATAGTAQEAAAAGDLVVVAIPLKAIYTLPVEPLAGKVVIDANNYYPQRDGHIAELDDGKKTSSELLAAHLPTSRVVKAFNHLYASDIANHGLPAGTPGRRALAIAGDDAAAKTQVTELLDEFGFDVVDAGPLAEGRRYEPGAPAYGPRLDAAQMKEALSADRSPS
jgi:predicted dinucleotide-binding enzyme